VAQSDEGIADCQGEERELTTWQIRLLSEFGIILGLLIAATGFSNSETACLGGRPCFSIGSFLVGLLGAVIIVASFAKLILSFVRPNIPQSETSN
jgi:hypothetical protein